MKNQPPLQAGNSGIPGSGCLGFSVLLVAAPGWTSLGANFVGPKPS